MESPQPRGSISRGPHAYPPGVCPGQPRSRVPPSMAPDAVRSRPAAGPGPRPWGSRNWSTSGRRRWRRSLASVANRWAGVQGRERRGPGRLRRGAPGAGRDAEACTQSRAGASSPCEPPRRCRRRRTRAARGRDRRAASSAWGRPASTAGAGASARSSEPSRVGREGSAMITSEGRYRPGGAGTLVELDGKASLGPARDEGGAAHRSGPTASSRITSGGPAARARTIARQRPSRQMARSCSPGCMP